MAGMTPSDGSVFGGGGSNAAFKKQLNNILSNSKHLFSV